jgi:hypothetical protein
MTQYVNEKVEKIERPAFMWFLFGVIGVLGSFYAFFVAGAIANVIEAKDITSNVALVTSTIGELESKYLFAKSSIDLEYAKSEGFSASQSGTIYIAKQGSAAISFNR